ncbi:MAG TPA: hypothetical protein VKU60_18360, partial [Chloroflexota bacterium]|nr:hypothetical protein [Chloroflexota bacterium]
TFAKLNGSDNLNTDIRPFEDAFGLPHSSINFRVDPNEPAPTTDPLDAMETVLDVSWSSAMAPGATVYVEEASNSTVAFADAIEDLVTTYNPDVISVSWVACESQVSPNDIHGLDTLLSTVTVPILVASGDSGSDGCGNGTTSTEWPPSDPYVTGVGGTSLAPDAFGNPQTESAWSNGFGASGGGFSSIFPEPSWQTGNAHRGVPDVSLLADPNTGFSMYDAAEGGWVAIGGTSGAAPALAGIIATVDQALGGRRTTSAGTSFNTQFYSNAGALNDIGAAGWDPVTGLGSVNANKLYAAWSGHGLEPAPSPTAAPGSGTFSGCVPSNPSGPFPFVYPVTYTGSDWSTCVTTVGSSSGTIARASTTGDTVYFDFSGTSVTFTYETNTDGGIANVTIDGAAPSSNATVDQSGASQAFGATTSWTGLSAGNHELAITISGTTGGSGNGTGTTLYVDSFTPAGGSAATPTSTVTVVTTATTTATATATVTGTVQPSSIRLIPATGAPGSSVSVTGTGFAPRSTITITFTDGSVTSTGSCAENGTGLATGCNIAVPSGAAPGAATISVSDGVNPPATASFTVTAPSTSFIVNTTADITPTPAASPTPAGASPCALATAGQCSLREAIQEGNALPPGSTITITVPDNTYTLTFGPLAITAASNIVIKGSSQAGTMIDGGATSQVITVAGGSVVTLDTLTIQNGNSQGTGGGGIQNGNTGTGVASLTLNNVTVSGNTTGTNATGGGG